MPTVRALCIVNPAAGRRMAKPAELDEALAILRHAGFELDVVETGEKEPSAAQLAERAVVERYDAAIVAGGDGTVQPAADKLLETGVVLGILPFGSFMNIANGLGIPLEPIPAAQVIARRRVRACDVGQVGPTVFYETAGVGLDAELFGAARMAERGRWDHALRRAWRAATQTSHRVTVTVDGESHAHRVYQILVLNSPYYAWSLPVVPDADMTDGKLDVAVFPRAGRLQLLRSVIQLWLSGGHQAPQVVYRGREVQLDCATPLPVHADNQLVAALPITLSCRQGALAVYAPEDAPGKT
jgi:diacylglycerol kinase (ATP)